MAQQQLRVYLPRVLSCDSLFPTMALDSRLAFSIPANIGSNKPLDVWHVESHGSGSPGKLYAPPGFPPKYDEIIQLSKSGVLVVTTTYLRSDVPSFDRFKSFFDIDDDAHQRNIRVYKGQHPDLSTARLRNDGSIAIAEQKELTTIVNTLANGSVRGFCVTQETVL